MRLMAAMSLYVGGPGSGCQGPDCGRPGTGITNQHKWHPPKEFMRLDLRQPHGFPTLFQNDDALRWGWSKDGSHLEIEQDDANENNSALGMSVKTMYSIPKSNIAYFGIDDSDHHVRSAEIPDGYVMDMEDR